MAMVRAFCIKNVFSFANKISRTLGHPQANSLTFPKKVRAIEAHIKEKWHRVGQQPFKAYYAERLQ
jgi:hypothetical protein